MYWAAENSKRYFAAGCATGTIDQLLLSMLQAKHAHLRGAVLLHSLVVVDEVHASDSYMAALLQAALARQVSAGGFCRNRKNQQTLTTTGSVAPQQVRYQ